MSILKRAASWLPVRPGEGRLFALTTALMLIPGAGIAIGVSGAESLLLSRVGAEALPRLYVALGLVTIVTTLGITTLMGRIPALRFYLLLPVVLIILLVGARFLVVLDHDWVYESLWVASALFHTLLQVMFWGIAGMIWDTRQAKRMYPLFAAADIAGFSTGGLITPVLVAWLGTANLLLGWAATLVVAYGLARIMARAAPGGGTPVKPRVQRVKRNVWEDVLSGFNYVMGSRLLFWMAVTVVVFQGLVYLLWFAFSSAVEIQFPNEDELTGFLGAFRGAATGIALLVSLFLATWINARFGLVASFVILAVFDLIGFSVLAVAGSFIAVVSLRFIHEVWQTGVARNAWQALFNVVPLVRREQTRLFISGVCLQAGAMVIGVVLLARGEAGASGGFYLVGVAAACLALFAAWRVRQAYLSALLEALRAGRPLIFQSEADPFAAFQRDPAERAIALSGLSSSDVAVRRSASAILVDLTEEEIVPTLVERLEDPDPQVRANLLRALDRTEAGSAQDQVMALLNDPETEVRVQAIFTLRSLVSDPHILEQHVRPLLEDPEPSVRAGAAATLLKLGSDSDALETLRHLARSDDVEARVEAVRAFAAWGEPSAAEPVEAALADPQPAVRRAAASALARVAGPQCPDALIRALGDEDHSVREAVAKSIGVFGSDALPATVTALADPGLEAGAILALFHLPVESQADKIRECARERIEEALRYYDRWQQVRAWATEDGYAELLADSLKQAAERHGINALRLLGTLENREAFQAAIDSLGSSDQGQGANAVEILDSVSDRHLVRPLLRLWEPGTADAQADSIDAFMESLRDADPWVRACAALAARRSNAEEVASEITRLARDDADETVRGAAAEALGEDKPMKELETLSVMERILFLKRVPLFTELAPVELKQVASITYERLFNDGELLAEQDEPGDELYIIVSGEVKVLYNDGKQWTELARRQPGEYVGEMAIISRAPRAARLTAVGEVRTLCIGQKQFEVILRERPETSMAVMQVLCDRLRNRDNQGSNNAPSAAAQSGGK